MSDPILPLESTALSAAGERRRRGIRDILIGRARARRVGRRVMAGAATVALLAGGSMLAWRVLAPAQSPPRELAHERRTIPAAPEQPDPMALRITVVANEPIGDRPCGAPTSAAPSGAAGVPVCILSDAQLLSALSTTGESYGIVRIGGRTRVVSNSPQ